jgi:phage-related protein
MIRQLTYYKDYFFDFFDAQNTKVKQKIAWTLDLICEIDRVPEKFLKHLEGTEGLYEIRVQTGNNIFRIFCFFDEGKLVVILNGFQKKSNKTPEKEIERAEKLRKEYFEDKQNGLLT